MLLSTVIYYIHPANYTIETVYFVQLEVFYKAGLLQFWVAFKSSAFTQPKWIFISVKLTEMKIARNSFSLRCAHVNTSIVCRLNRYRPFAVNSSVHLVKKFEWQLIFCLNTLIFISQTHMQKFSTYFSAVFF